MKKYLPIIILGVGILVLGGVFMFLRGKKSPETPKEEDSLIILPLEKRPVVSLTPTEDGHYLNLKIEKIAVEGATSLDYLLLYETSAGVPQGVPGTIQLDGKDVVTEDLLLGSESSGKFRYDEGVEKGSIELSFRDSGGKLITKSLSEFLMGKIDNSEKFFREGEFTYQRLQKSLIKGYLVLMETYGVPEMPQQAEVSKGPYGLFASSEIGMEGKVTIQSENSFLIWDKEEGLWKNFQEGENYGTGFYVSTN